MDITRPHSTVRDLVSAIIKELGLETSPGLGNQVNRIVRNTLDR